MSEILHNHKQPNETIFRPHCPRCKLNYAAQMLLTACELAVSCMAGYEEMQGWRKQIQATIDAAK